MVYLLLVTSMIALIIGTLLADIKVPETLFAIAAIFVLQAIGLAIYEHE